MPLSLALVFHFNQHTTEYADIADRACYRGLLNVLHAHPRLKFNLHLSGTLLRALPWFGAETIELVRAGVAAGQFELLGSTYAQNVPYASDDWDNAQQIGLHREVVEAIFGVRPTVFWNSERTWRQSLVPVIAEGGYTTTLVEDHILHAAGLVDPVPVITASGQPALTAVYDDTILRSRLDYAVWFGRRRQFFDYLRRVAERRGAGRFFLACAEDAEAMGLWGWENGYLPQAAWANLDGLLTEIEESGMIRLRHLSSARAELSLTPLPDGAAQWMDRSLLHRKAPYHEDGYADWFDFNRRSPKLAYFRRLYDIVRSRLQALGSARSDPGFPQPAATPADEFYRQAIEALCHHQYEFGCIGVGGRGDWGWEGARTALLFARVTEIADDPRPWHWIEDVNGDGSDEQLLCDGRYLAVFTAHGGRLIYWFDLVEGRQWLGNHLAVPAARYEEGATKQPHLAPVPRLWLPQAFEADLKAWRSLRKKEAAPTRMGRYLPAWVFEGEPAQLNVYRRRMKPAGRRLPLRAQVGGFNDLILIDNREECPPDNLLDYRLEPEGPCYLIHPAPGVLIEKHVRQDGAGVAVRYVIENRGRTARRLRLKFSNELCPDYREALPKGRAGLSFFMFDGLYPAVVNTVTRSALALEPSLEWTKLERTVNLLALEVWLTFELGLPPRSEKSLEIQLKICKL